MEDEKFYAYLERRDSVPNLVRKFSEDFEGWIWGEGAHYLVGLTDSVKDNLWKVIIPSDELLDKALNYVPVGAKRTSPLSFRFDVLDKPYYKIDLRMTDVSWYLNQPEYRGSNQYAINMNYNSIHEIKSVFALPPGGFNYKSKS